MKGQLESVRAFCYVSDIIDGINIIAELNKGVNVYNIGNPDPIPFATAIKSGLIFAHS